jgi:hypothetical protein
MRMSNVSQAIRGQLARQVEHWTIATKNLSDLDELASAEAWRQLEQYLGITIRRDLTLSSERLEKRMALLRAGLRAALSLTELKAVNQMLLECRLEYLRTETTLEFFADAIRSRTDARLSGLLRACDSLAYRSMSLVLDQIDKKTPIALTYLDKGLGASILKAGLRLWDGSDNPVAVVKVTLHNLSRITSLLHECGHQVAHLTGWTEELAKGYRDGLGGSPNTAETWANWTSEIVADTHAFVHSGFAAVATLHDVVAGDHSMVFRLLPGDPHPMAFLRVLLGVEMCRLEFGPGPWDDLALAWTELHPISAAPEESADLIRASLPLLPRAANIALHQKVPGFRSRSICELVRPERVRPEALYELERRLGPALFTSTHWIWTESLRLVALSGLRWATLPDKAEEYANKLQACMLLLGGAAQAA